METTQTQKDNITIVGKEKVPARLVDMCILSINKAFESVDKKVDNMIINFLENHPKKEHKNIYSSFVAPNFISINSYKHLEQMDNMAQNHYMRASAVLWYELLLSINHELYHMLYEYAAFEEEHRDDDGALQNGPKHDCIAAEKWAKKQVLALGFEFDINPPEEWATGISETDYLSEELSEWQHELPGIDERWAKRQQEMIDKNLVWLDNDVKPSITLDKFSDWLAIEGGWTIPVWEVKLETKMTADTATTEKVITKEVPDIEEQSVVIEKTTDVIEEPITYEEDSGVPEFMTNPIVNPTLEEMKIAMYHTFMAIYNQIFEKCGWNVGQNGFTFTNTDAIHENIVISTLPNTERVIVNYVNSNKTITPVWPNGFICGIMFVNGTIPAVKLGIRSTTGKIFTYTAVAQNPMKDSAWGKSARAGVKSMVIFRNEDSNRSSISARIIDGQFIANPLGLNGGQATTIVV